MSNKANKFRTYITVNGIDNYLTEKELIIISYLAKGMKFKDISNKLNISIPTVNSHVCTIKIKFNCNSLFQLGISLGHIKDQILNKTT